MSGMWPYVAGIVDGEGTICLHINNFGTYFLQIIIYNSSLVLMKWLVGNFGGKYYVRTKQITSKRIQYAWHPSGKKNREKFLLGIIPYLVIKKEQAKLALEFDRVGYDEKETRKAMTAKMRFLNSGEESATTNTFDVGSDSLKIESDLIGDYESGPVVTQESQ
jgi:hypothetical protein